MDSDDAAHASWAFRVKIKLGGDYRWTTARPKAARADLNYRGHTLTCRSDDGTSPIAESEWVIFVGRGFGSADEATQVGRSLHEHLRVASVWSNMPMDVGEVDEVLSRLGPAAIPVDVAPDVHGLSVFEDTGRVHVFSARARGQVNR